MGQNRFLSVVVELAPGIEAEGRNGKRSLPIQVQLLRLNSEFANYVPVGIPDAAALAPTGDPVFSIK